MELLKSILETLLLIVFGISGIIWQIVSWNDKSERLFLWIGIIPLPIGIGGVVSLVWGLYNLGKLVHIF